MIIENYSTGALHKHINNNKKRMVIISNRPYYIYGAMKQHLFKFKINIEEYNTIILYYKQKKTSVHDISLYKIKRAGTEHDH